MIVDDMTVLVRVKVGVFGVVNEDEVPNAIKARRAFADNRDILFLRDEKRMLLRDMISLQSKM